jgi:hypothetical protein
VYMPDLGGSDGNVQVTAYGSDNTHCKVALWSSLGSERSIEVRCFNSAGNAADARFTVLYQGHGPFDVYAEGAAAYLWANSPTSASYTPSALYQFNSEGGTNTITRTAAGTYDVRLAGISTQGGTVLVTAYGTSSDRCKVGSWLPSGADTVVRVYCHSVAGLPTDSMFTLSYTVDTVPVGAGDRYGSLYGAYTWTGGSVPGTTALSSTYSWSVFSASVGTRTRVSTGRYTVTFDGLSWAPDTRTLALVTAYGSSAGYCKVESWLESAGDTVVNVRCYDGSGVLADSMFDLTFQTTMVPLI